MRHLHRHDYVIDRSHPDPDRWKLRWGAGLLLLAAAGAVAFAVLS